MAVVEKIRGKSVKRAAHPLYLLHFIRFPHTNANASRLIFLHLRFPNSDRKMGQAIGKSGFVFRFVHKLRVLKIGGSHSVEVRGDRGRRKVHPEAADDRTVGQEAA